MNTIIEYQYFGNVNYYKNLCRSSNIFFEVYENYQKRGFRNKLELASSTGIQLLSIPIVGGRETKKPFFQIEIDYSNNWQKQHIKSIVSLYNRSAWFEYYKNDLFELYKNRPLLLKDWNRITIEWVCKKLKMDVILSETTSFKTDYNTSEYIDGRGQFLQEAYESTNLFKKYSQVFQDKTDFLPNLCILDLLFCEGPNALNYLKDVHHENKE